MNIYRILLLTLSLAWSMSAVAQYQWVDKDGRKVYSDRPPPSEIPQKNIVAQPGGARSGSAAAIADDATGLRDPLAPGSAASAPKPGLGVLKIGGTDKDLEAKKKEADDAEAARKKADADKQAKVRENNCKLAKQGMSTMDSGMRLAQIDAKGERVILDDNARAAEVKRYQAVINTDCK